MTQKKKFITCDGNYAAAHIAYMFSEVAAIYPITPSSTMAEYVDEWSANGRKNIFGETVKVTEMQSEAGASGAVHGSLQAGALTSTYTASQGLLLMIPNMYKMSGELLPAVFHVSARSLAAQALSIFGDHSDIYSARQSGFAFLATSGVQEVMDLAGIAHLAAIKSRVPFVHFFDGFRTSHEIQKIELIDEEKLANLIDKKALSEFRNRALNPDHPVTRGTAQNPDIYFQTREAANKFYYSLPDIVEDYMKQITAITGREYHPFNYYGASDAENIIVAMGSITETIKEVIDNSNQNGEKLGVIIVHLYRPFSEKYFFNVLPKTVKKIAVLDRTKEPGATGEPLYLDVIEMFNSKANKPLIIGGRYGLSSKDTTPSMVLSVFNNLKLAEPKNKFTVGIVDDVTFHSLPLTEDIDISDESTFQAKFYGIGSDGTVGANKNSIKIIGETTDKYCQAYFAYDSKKSGGVTTSHLRFGNKPIRSPYLVNTPDFVACHVPAYMEMYDVLKGIKKGGTFLLNSIWEKDNIEIHLPDKVKKVLAEKQVKFYIINATAIAEELGLGTRTNTIMQSAFFKVANVIPYDLAITEMKKAVVKSFGRKGDEVVNMNIAAIESGNNIIKVDVPMEWANIEIKQKESADNVPEFITKIVQPINSLKGDDLPVSVFNNYEDGTFIAGTSAYEKRGIAVSVPKWKSNICIQCNQCTFVCPHACIRPFLISKEEMLALPKGIETIDAKPNSLSEYQFRIQVSALDCTGCGNCIDVCPAKPEKALEFMPLDSQRGEQDNWDAVIKNVTYKDTLADKYSNVKNSQFAQPLFEFSGACAGCGETPYIKLITQLYGDRMMVANATGCSSIYGGSAPSTPYTKNACGKGPSWANSLFEDNAEYGYGMATAVGKMRERIKERLEYLITNSNNIELKETAKKWIENKNNAKESKATSDLLLTLLKKDSSEIAKELVDLEQYFEKKSIWMFGGDGWAYDIGFGGLDHVIASGEDVNILVLDTEVYSNTGGQSSKSTPIGAVAKFASSGKKIRKKDLGQIAMSYGYVYVAQVAMGANQAQYLKALREAEAYPGPSLIIAYSPCINHGLKAGMGKTQAQQKKAVEAGYWMLYRFDPRLEAEGKNPLQIDSKEPEFEKFQEFLHSEVRYTSLISTFPKEADELFKAAEKDAKWKYKNYIRQAKIDFSE